MITGEFLVDKITPWVEDVRQDLFYSREAPFKTAMEASEWLTDVIAKEIEVIEANSRGTMNSWTNFLLRNHPSVYYYKLHKEHGAPLPNIFLVRWAEEIAKATGFNNADVELYILTGTNPTLQRMEEKIHEVPLGEDWISRFVTVTIRGEISYKEFFDLYQRVRDKLRIRRSKPLNEKHLQLYCLVKLKGGPVCGKGAVAFWESINQEWHNPASKTWKGAKVAYVRLGKRLNERFLTEKPKQIKGGANES